MAISRFSNSRIGAGFPKYTRFWDQTTTTTPSTITADFLVIITQVLFIWYIEMI